MRFEVVELDLQGFDDYTYPLRVFGPGILGLIVVVVLLIQLPANLDYNKSQISRAEN